MKHFLGKVLLAVGIVGLFWAPLNFSRTPHAADHILTSAPLDTDSAGKGGTGALASVVRVMCTKEGTGGTGFVHKSGHIITAAHVVSECERSQISVLGAGIKGPFKVADIIALDTMLDIALLKINEQITLPPKVVLAISRNSNLTFGAQVTTWGYPAGYGEIVPLLSVGYLAGQGKLWNSDGTLSPSRWYVNAAFNSGNSGGPMLRVEDGQVIGVVSSKLAPMPQNIESALQVLKSQKRGVNVYARTLPDGTLEKKSEGQLIHEVLQYLRRQTQLVIGHAVMLSDLRKFLQDNGIEP